MSEALHLVERVLEGEDPKHFFKRVMPRQSEKLFDVGEEVIHGTGLTRDIMDACLAKLKDLDPAAYDHQLNDEVAAYLRGEEPEDFDPEYYLYERLYVVMQKYCPLFTYFGSSEGDGTRIGCWPPDRMTIHEWTEGGPLIYVEETEEPDRFEAIMSGDFSSVIRYVLLEDEHGTMFLLDKTTRTTLWEY